MDKLVLELGRQILTKDRDWTPDYIVGIVGDGLIPAAMLARFMDVPLHTLDVKGDESNCWMAEEAYGYIPKEIENPSLLDVAHYSKRILIVDDYCETGDTFNWIKKDWMAGCMPDDVKRWNQVWHDKVRFAVLVENIGHGQLFQVDYSADTVIKQNEHAVMPTLYKEWWKK